ncbi:hypothetical protein [Nocardioides sp. SYSU D00038]|uniref:hypothetical protein n=1 Tax=Nocardioides sp. SYSU D00038 TaxID=2812554 RepID=UPI0019685059|nr:hypothetical protein [Nocardioides sp. SYSU D00038]
MDDAGDLLTAFLCVLVAGAVLGRASRSSSVGVPLEAAEVPPEHHASYLTLALVGAAGTIAGTWLPEVGVVGALLVLGYSVPLYVALRRRGVPGGGTALVALVALGVATARVVEVL